MDLNLTLGYQEQNDNKAIVLTDTTNNYDATSATSLVAGNTPVVGTVYEILADTGTTDFTLIGAVTGATGERFVCSGVPIAIAGSDEIVAVTPTIAEITAATLDTTITGVDNTATIKTQVDLFTEFGGAWTNQSEMVYTITSQLLGDGTDDLLLDGLYELDYAITYLPVGSSASKTETLNVTILVYGQVKVAVYDKLRQIPAWCNCKDNEKLHSILEADLCGAYLTGIETSAYIAKTEELINMLIVLDDMVKNGSKLYY